MNPSIDATLPTGTTVIETGDSLDEKNADLLMSQVRDLIGNGLEMVIFDCTKLDYLTSFGLTVFLRTRKLLRQKHSDVDPATDSAAAAAEVQRVRLTCVKPHVVDVLRTARLLDILPVFDCVSAAVD